MSKGRLFHARGADERSLTELFSLVRGINSCSLTVPGSWHRTEILVISEY